MANDEGPVLQRARLRGELRRLREQAQLTQEVAARALEWSTIKILRIEAGHNSISMVDLDALLTLYNLNSQLERERLREQNRESRERPWWWWEGHGQVSAAMLNYIGYEAGTTSIMQSPGPNLPELLQTPEYAKAHIAGMLSSQLKVSKKNYRDSELIDSMVKLLQTRQDQLARRSEPPRQKYFLDEGAVRRHVAIESDPTVMPRQLRHIADTAERGELVTVQVIPFTAGAHAGMASQITLLEFDDLPSRIYVDASWDILVKEGGGWGIDIEEYMAIFEALDKSALSPDESMTFIRNVAADMTELARGLP